MPENRFRSNWLLHISAGALLTLVLACCAHRKEKQTTAPPAEGQLKEMPKPGVQNPEQADSLKRALDAERQRRLKDKK